MNASNDFDRLVASWLASSGPTEMHPDAVRDALAVSRRTRQRRGVPAWLAGPAAWPLRGPERALGRLGRPDRRLVWLAFVALLIASMLLGALIAGGQRRLPPPFGPARNGAIAYAAGGALYLGDPVTGRSRQITSGPRQDAEPWFSPDGQQIAFYRSTDNADWEDIVVADADGSSQRVVTTTPVHNANWLDWSPDGRVLWFVSEVNGTAELQRVDADGTGYRLMVEVVTQDEPALRPPNGREILYRVVDGADVTLYLMNADGSNRRALIHDTSTNPEYDLRGPRWSPDGSRIAIMRWSDSLSQMRVWVMDADGRGLHQLRADPTTWFEGWPVWSPDGTRVAIQRGVGTARTFGPDGQPFGVLRVDGNQPAVPTGPAWWGTGQRVEWSPDGQYLLFKGDDSRQLLLDPGGGPWSPAPWQSVSYPAWQRLAP